MANFGFAGAEIQYNPTNKHTLAASTATCVMSLKHTVLQYTICTLHSCLCHESQTHSTPIHYLHSAASYDLLAAATIYQKVSVSSFIF